MKNNFEKFTVSQAAILIRNGRCLILEFASNPSAWGLPGGRIDVGEEREKSFRREIKEELNISNFEIHGLVAFDVWRGAKNTPVSAVAFLIKNDVDKIELSDEHTGMAWVEETDLHNYIFLWPNVKLMIEKGFAYQRNLLK